MTIASNSGVYCFRNTQNGKRYVGSSKQLRFRKSQHLSLLAKGLHHSRYLQHAWNKYGEGAFIFEVLERCEPVKAILLAREQHWLDLYKSYEPEFGYNHLSKAGSRLGSKATPEALAKMRGRKQSDEWKAEASIRATAYMNDPERKEFYRNLRIGKTWEELFGDRVAEVKKRHGAARSAAGMPEGFEPWNKGVPIADEHKAALFAGRDAWQAEHGSWNKGTTGLTVAWNKGIPHSEEAKKKMSQAHIGKPATWNKGLVRSVEMKRKVAATNGKLYHFEGEDRSVAEIAQMAGIKRTTLRNRLKYGWPIDIAATPTVNTV